MGCRQTGNEVYIRNLLGQFGALDRESAFIAYVSKPGAISAIPSGFRHATVSANPFRRLGLDLSRRLQKDRPELLHVQYTAPLLSNVPVVASVHDVSFLECPRFFTPARALQLRMTVARTLKTAARVITVSDFSRRAILRHYGGAPERVVMIPNGVSSAFRPMNRQTASRRIAEEFGISAPFVLTVGDLQPRKNHLGLLAAFESLLRARPELPHQLVLVGKDSWYSADLYRAVERSAVRNRVHLTGFVTDADLLNFYGACDLFVFPSFYEGFGLPILEAMACGREVACSNTTAMPEVAGGASILFSPHSVTEIARAMASALSDPNLRASLEQRGLRRARLFTWERAARLTLDVYHEVAGSPRRFSSRSCDDADRALLTAAAR